MSFFKRKSKVADALTLDTGVRSQSRFGMIVLALISPALLFFGLSTLIREVKFELRGVKTLGTVVAAEPDGFHKGRQQYRLVYEFTDSQMIGRQAWSNYKTSSPQAPGTPIEVIYLPDNPNRSEINNWFQRWFLSMMLAGMGASFAAMSLLGWREIMRLKAGGELRDQRGGAETPAKFIAAKKNWLLATKYSKSWYIVAEATTLTGQRVQLKSEPIWDIDPNTWARADIPIPAKIDTQNPARHWLYVDRYFEACRAAGPTTVM